MLESHVPKTKFVNLLQPEDLDHGVVVLSSLSNSFADAVFENIRINRLLFMSSAPNSDFESDMLISSAIEAIVNVQELYTVIYW